MFDLGSASLTIDGAADGQVNMRRDLASLHQAEGGQASARVYAWDGIWVSLGRFQRPESVLLDRNTPWVVRPTGGAAVLHGHDVTVALAMPISVTRDVRSLHGIYRALCTPLLLALRGCGLDARFASDVDAKGTSSLADCFSSLGAYDVVDAATGRKVCGCAMRVTRTAALLQASVPYGPALRPVEVVIQGGKTLPPILWDHRRFSAEFRLALSDGRMASTEPKN